MVGAFPSPDRLADPARLLDGAADPPLDRLTRLAARVLEVPVALVALVDADRLVFRSNVGRAEPDDPLAHALCRRVVATGAPLVVADAREDERLRADLAAPDLAVVAYLGVPIESPDGHVLGALCAIDGRPQTWSEDDVQTLRDLAGSATAELRLREALGDARAAEHRYEATFAAASIGMGIQSPDRRWQQVNDALCVLAGREAATLLEMTGPQIAHPADLAADAREIARLVDGAVASVRLEQRWQRPDGHAVWVDVSVSLVRDEAGAPRHLVLQAYDVTERRRAGDALQMSEERFRMAMRHAPGGIAITVPATGELLQVNRALCDLLGTTEGELVVRRLADVVHPDDTARDAEFERRFAAGEQDVYRTERRLLHADGSVLDVVLNAALVRDADGEPLYAVLQTEDLTERRGLLAEREHFFEVSMDMLAVFAEDGTFLDLSRAWEATLGWTAEEMLGRPLIDFVHPEDIQHTRTEARRLHVSGQDTVDFENRCRCRDGSYRWLRWSGGSDGARRKVYAVARDVTERRAEEAELVHLAAHDPLTGLLNRRAFAADVEAHLLRARRYERGGALLVLDLDDFKDVNDSLGHRAGDELIAGIARVLRASVRESDVLARLGGDEFAVLLPEGGAEEAIGVADKLVAAVADYAPSLAGRPHRGVTVSIGMATIGRDDRPADDLLAEADLAMYDAKESGGNRWAASSPEAPRPRTRPAWVDRIRRALAEDGFELYAQPIVDLESGRVTQHELLLRMGAEEGEPIPPGAFLPAAERFDLVQEIDRWVVGQAIDLLAFDGPTGMPGTLEVNLSGRSLSDPRLLDTVQRRLAGSGVDPSRLVLEISETAAMADIEVARRFGDRATKLGCRLALDDFGAGFGSFHYFEHLPFHFLKIDGDFITSCLTSRTDRLVVDAVVSWARGLGKRTIAEFTPDAPTLDLLRTIGVDFAQGHFVGMPRPLPRDLEIDSLHG